jgi:HEAT repeat protein
MRVAALRDLARYVDEHRHAVIGALERGLVDPNAEVRSAAAVGLADARGVEALPALLVAVEDEDAHVRQMALSAVGELGDGRARERLRRALTDVRPEVRFQALIAFSRVAPDEAASALSAGMADQDAAIRYIAVRCAEESGGAVEALQQEIELRLEDADAPVRVAAAIVLSRCKNARAVATLLDVVSGRVGPIEPEDEAAAVELLGELEVQEAVPHLEKRAFRIFSWDRSPFAWHATVALARMGHPKARSRIVQDLSSWSRDRRTLAVAAAGRARLIEARPIIAAMQGDDRRAEPGAVEHSLQELAQRDVAHFDEATH